jgi:hypothetical protein
MYRAAKIYIKRGNHMRSCGPKTPGGKAVSRLNATRHGIFSRLAVLPNMEQQLDWENHLSSTVNDLKPRGYLEQNLVERVALLLWRLGRVARHERESSALAQEEVVEYVAELRNVRGLFSGSRRFSSGSELNDSPHPDDAAAIARCAKQGLILIERFPNLPDEERLTPDQATSLIFSFESAAKVDIHSADFPSFPGVPDHLMLEEFEAWTAGLVRGAWKVIAAVCGNSIDVVYASALDNARVEFAAADHERKRVIAELDRCRRRRLLPPPEELDRISRYEAHLERCLYRALHELQRLQAARNGNMIPPLAVDVNVNSAITELQNEPL